MILLFGFQTVKTPVKDGLTLRRQCDRCHFISDLHEYRARNFFMLFFLPVFPLAKVHELLLCSRCQAEFYPRKEDYLAAGKDIPASLSQAQSGLPRVDNLIIMCSFCHGKLRLPVPHKRLLVTCPHCREQFNYVPKL